MVALLQVYMYLFFAGACYVGNLSDIGLQVLVATPLFCYWIFGSMNLISGNLVVRRNKNLITATYSANTPQHHQQHQQQHQLQRNNSNSGYATFLSIYCVPYTILLFAVIYEFVNIDSWLNDQERPNILAKNGFTTPLWPFLTKTFMELMLGIICSAWALGPKISTMYKQKLNTSTIKKVPQTKQRHIASVAGSSQNSNVAYTTVSYQTVRHQSHAPHQHSSSRHSSSSVSMQQISKYSSNNSRSSKSRQWKCKQTQQLPCSRYGNETIL